MVQRTEEDWQSREQELLDRIVSLENEHKSTIDTHERKYEILTAILSKSKEENAALAQKMANMDKELTNKQMLFGAEEDKCNDILKKAKILLFEQTKISKNQEMQLIALNTQVASLKDVLTVTREMLEIRNTEIDYMKTRMESVEERLKTERDLMERRYNIADKMYKHLKQEHDIQTGLFKELKDGYQKKIEILKQELAKENEGATKKL